MQDAGHLWATWVDPQLSYGVWTVVNVGQVAKVAFGEESVWNVEVDKHSVGSLVGRNMIKLMSNSVGVEGFRLHKRKGSRLSEGDGHAGN